MSGGTGAVILSGYRAGFLQRCDTPWFPAAVAGLAALAVVLARLAVAAKGNIASFIIAGTHYTNPRQVPRGIPVMTGNGYDGQFYYRLALDPADLAHTAFGVRFDSFLRLERIGYPTLVWLASAGHAAAVPAALVGVNVAGLALLGVGGGLLARESGKHAAWGLVFPGYWGYLWTISRDLTEIVTAAFLVLGLVAYRRHRYLLAGLAFTVAVLSKETVVLPVAVLGFLRIGEVIRLWSPSCAGSRDVGSDYPVADSHFGAPDVAWILPGFVYLSWQLLVLGTIGHLPILSSSQHNLGVPFVGIVDAARQYVSAIPQTASLLWCGELGVLLWVTTSAARAWYSSTALRFERFAWIVFVVLVLSLASGIWNGDVGFRSLDELYLFGCVVLLGARDRRPLGALLIGVLSATWVVVAGELILFR